MQRWLSNLGNLSAIKSCYVVIVAVGLLASQLPIARTIDNWLLDAQFRVLRTIQPRPIVDDIVIVGIDEESYEKSDRPVGVWHQPIGKFITALIESEAKVIAFDVVLPVKKYATLIEGHNKVLELAVVKAKRANIPVIVSDSADTQNRKIRPYGLLESLLGDHSFATPLMPQDRDGVVRRYVVNHQQGLPASETIAGKIALAAEPDLVLKTAQQGQYIDYSIGELFQYLPFYKVLELIDTQDIQQIKQLFHQRVVLVGDTTAYTDTLKPALPLAQWLEQPNQPGVLLHAQAYRSLTHGGLLRPTHFLITALLIALISMIVFMGQFYRIASAVLAGLMLFIVSAGMIRLGWVFHIAPLLFTALLANIVSTAMDAMETMREKKRLKASFGKYVSPEILNQIVDGAITPQSKAENRHISVLISDIRGFTNRSSNESAMNIVSILNRYFERMTKIVHQHDGTVDKFMGDGLLAFFGAPNDLENPAANAASAGLEMMKALESLNIELDHDNIPSIEIGIGIATGTAAVGHVGSNQRHEYTAIGSVVNIAARLESMTKDLKRSIICDSETSRGLETGYKLDSLGYHRIRGLDEDIEIHFIGVPEL